MVMDFCTQKRESVKEKGEDKIEHVDSWKPYK